jgi:hypothetical protein
MTHLHEHTEKGWRHVVKDEFLCHFPYAIFSVLLSVIFVTLFNYITWSEGAATVAHRLFHGFHFLHLIFAGAGVVLSFRRYSNRIISCLMVGVLVPTFFCTLSDAVLPYFGGRLMSLPMQFHWCFKDHVSIVLPFLGLGIANGWVMSGHSLNRRIFYSTGSHFLHILISSMASVFYLVSFGLTNMWDHIGMVFLFLVIAVLVPCTLSDIVVPIYFATSSRFNDKKIRDEIDCSCSNDGGTNDERH